MLLINETHIAYLIRTPNNQLSIGYYPIVNEYKEVFLKIDALFRDESLTTMDVLKYIYLYHVELFRGYYYADKLNDSYETIQEFRFSDAITWQKDLLKRKLKIMERSMCHKCSLDPLVNEISPLHYSHKVSGFFSQIINLTDSLKCQIKTNFGYGLSSYFYSILEYRDVTIYRFTNLIRYRVISRAEIIGCTYSYELLDSSWIDLYEDVIRAYKTLVINEQTFINEYIINECIELIKGLKELYSNNDEKKYIKNVNPTTIKDFDATSMMGTLAIRELINFKAEKLSYSLAFIEKIIQLSEYVDVENIVLEIQNLNRLVYPLIQKELTGIEEDLPLLSEKVDSLFSRYKIALDNAEKRKLEYVQNEKQLNDLELIVARNDYERHLKEYMRLFDAYYQVKSIHDESILVKTTLTEYMKNINDYFVANNLSLTCS